MVGGRNVRSGHLPQRPAPRVLRGSDWGVNCLHVRILSCVPEGRQPCRVVPPFSEGGVSPSPAWPLCVFQQTRLQRPLLRDGDTREAPGTGARQAKRLRLQNHVRPDVQRPPQEGQGTVSQRRPVGGVLGAGAAALLPLQRSRCLLAAAPAGGTWALAGAGKGLTSLGGGTGKQPVLGALPGSARVSPRPVLEGRALQGPPTGRGGVGAWEDAEGPALAAGALPLCWIPHLHGIPGPQQRLGRLGSRKTTWRGGPATTAFGTRAVEGEKDAVARSAATGQNRDLRPPAGRVGPAVPPAVCPPPGVPEGRHAGAAVFSLEQELGPGDRQTSCLQAWVTSVWLSPGLRSL